MKKIKLYFNKQIYLGTSILDISKTLMYDFNYKYMKPKYGDRAKLLLTDTDSLVYETQTEDFYKDISPDAKKLFDTSNYPSDHSSGIPIGENKKVPGLFKDEVRGKQIAKFIGLRAKLYSYIIHKSLHEEKKCKGIKKSVIKNNITFDDYKKCLFSQELQMRSMNVIRSHKHDFYTEEVNKIGLSANDDKRIILSDKIHTHAHRHYCSSCS